MTDTSLIALVIISPLPFQSRVKRTWILSSFSQSTSTPDVEGGARRCMEEEKVHLKMKWLLSLSEKVLDRSIYFRYKSSFPCRNHSSKRKKLVLIFPSLENSRKCSVQDPQWFENHSKVSFYKSKDAVYY